MLHPSQARDEAVHPLDIVTTDDHKFIEIWDYISESGAQTIEGYTSNVSFAVYSLLFYQDLAREYVPLGQHIQLPAAEHA